MTASCHGAMIPDVSIRFCHSAKTGRTVTTAIALRSGAMLSPVVSLSSNAILGAAFTVTPPMKARKREQMIHGVGRRPMMGIIGRSRRPSRSRLCAQSPVGLAPSEFVPQQKHRGHLKILLRDRAVCRIADEIAETCFATDHPMLVNEVEA